MVDSFGILPACCAAIISSNGTVFVAFVVVQDDACLVSGRRVDLDKNGRTFTFLVRVLVGAIAPARVLVIPVDGLAPWMSIPITLLAAKVRAVEAARGARHPGFTVSFVEPRRCAAAGSNLPCPTISVA